MVHVGEWNTGRIHSYVYLLDLLLHGDWVGSEHPQHLCMSLDLYCPVNDPIYMYHCTMFYQKPTIIDSTGSSNEEETDGESDFTDSESETTTSCIDCRPNADETTAPGQPRPRAESPNSRKVVTHC